MKTLFRIFFTVQFAILVWNCDRSKHDYYVEAEEIIRLTDSTCLLAFKIDNISNVIELGYVLSDNIDFSKAESNSSADSINEGVHYLIIRNHFYFGMTYYCKVYTKTENTIFFSNALDFIGSYKTESYLSVISPSSGTWIDTIVLKGSFYCCNDSIVDVKIGNYPTEIIYKSDTLVKVIIPPELDNIKSLFTIYTTNDTISNPLAFTLDPPEITEFSPEIGERGMELIIKGKNFCTDKVRNIITVGLYTANIKSVLEDQIITEIPQQISGDSLYDIAVVSSSQKTIADKKYRNIESWEKINNGQGIIPRSLFNILSIPFVMDNKCYLALFNDFQPRIGKCNNIIFEFNPITNESKAVFYYLDYYNSNIGLFTSAGKIYIKRDNKLDEADLISKTFISQQDFPGSLLKSTFFSISNSGFVFTADNEFWCFEPNNNTWTRINNVPSGELIKNMTISEICFLMFKSQDNSLIFYSYYRSTDTWQLLANYNNTGEMRNILDSSTDWKSNGELGFSLTKNISEYPDMKHLIYIFDPLKVSWIKRAGPYPIEEFDDSFYSSNAYVTNDKIYVKYIKSVSGDLQNFHNWEYSISKLPY